MPPSILPFYKRLGSLSTQWPIKHRGYAVPPSKLEERTEKSFQSDPLRSVPLAYDFKRPQRVNKDRIRAVESLHEQFCRLFSSTFAASMRMVVDVDMAFVDQPLYGEFILSSYTVWRLHFTMNPLEAKHSSA